MNEPDRINKRLAIEIMKLHTKDGDWWWYNEKAKYIYLCKSHTFAPADSCDWAKVWDPYGNIAHAMECLIKWPMSWKIESGVKSKISFLMGPGVTVTISPVVQENRYTPKGPYIGEADTAQEAIALALVAALGDVK